MAKDSPRSSRRDLLVAAVRWPLLVAIGWIAVAAVRRGSDAPARASVCPPGGGCQGCSARNGCALIDEMSRGPQATDLPATDREEDDRT